MSRAVASLAIAILLVGCGKPTTPVPSSAQPARLAIPEPVDEVRLDFEDGKDTDWSPPGKWQVRNVGVAPSGRHVLQRVALDDSAPALTWEGDEFADVEVSAKFRALGQRVSEVGLVVRYSDGSYNVVRLEPGGRAVLSGCVTGGLDVRGALSIGPWSVTDWHTLTVAAIGDQIQARLDSAICLTARDPRFKKGKVGLWWIGEDPIQVDDVVIRTHATPVEEFDGLDWNGVAAQARMRFFGWANREECPCGSGRSLARCRKAGCAKALERGRDVLEQCEGE